MRAKNGQLPINALRNGTISLEAKGLLCVLLDPGVGWACSTIELMEYTGAGKSIICRCWKELETAGFLERKQIREGGKFGSCEYIVKELAFIW